MFQIKSRKAHDNIKFKATTKYLEISSGRCTRIEKVNELKERITNKGLKVESFEYHLSTYKYGVPPHAGCGIGLERLMMALTGTENIRDTAFYPRDVDRLTP